MRWRWAASAALALRALLLTAQGHAGEGDSPPPFVRLVYVPPLATAGQCPRAEAFEDAVTARLGRFAFSEVSPILLVVVLERDAMGGYLGRMFVRAEGETSGERQLRLRSCRDVVQSLAVAASVLLAPVNSLTDEPDPSASEDVPPPLTLALVPPPIGLARPALDPFPFERRPAPSLFIRDVPAEPETEWQLAAAPVLDLHGTGLGAATFGVAVLAAAVRERMALAVEVRALAPTSESVGRGLVSTRTVAASVLPCGRLRGFMLCGTLTGGAVFAEGMGFDENRLLVRPYVSAGARLGYEVGGRRLGLRPYLWTEAPITRWTFTVDGSAAVRQPAITLGLGLDLLVRL